jgi:hypothetical protein
LNKKLLTVAASIGTAIGLGLGACTGGGGGTTITPVPASGSTIRITINAGSSNVCSYFNAPCATVTICQSGTSNCDTVSNVLVDTGSFGLRVFSSLLPNTNNLLPAMQSSNAQPISECVFYADGTANWGPIKYASVTLNSTTTATQIPIQVIDASYPGASNCSGASATPTDFGVNGILGIGPLQTDQGYSGYFTCNGNNCNQILPPAYVTNPITQFASDNNGLTLTFASVPSSGAASADGYGVFGVGTNNANTPGSGTHIFQINGTGLTVNSTFRETTYPSYLDTGSQGYYFTSQFWPNCGGSLNGFFCPSSEISDSATMTGIDGLGNTASATINFNIGNASDLLNNSTNNAFSNIGVNIASLAGSSPLIDWGLPFYLGKTVYMVFAGKTATVNGVTLPASSSGYWIY